MEVKLDVDQKIRQFVLAMKEDTSGAVYGYTILGKKRRSSEYAQRASGTIGTQAGSSRKGDYGKRAGGNKRERSGVPHAESSLIAREMLRQRTAFRSLQSFSSLLIRRRLQKGI